MLNVPPDASSSEITSQWKKLQKSCHPDVAGAYAETAAALLNEARQVLISEPDRQAFDADRNDWLKRGGSDQDLFNTFNNKPLSNWSGVNADSGNADSSSTQKAVFVDESHCIGCIQCAVAAPNTFRIEQRFGRARVVDQWADSTDNVLDAIEICPVRCIHQLPKSELPIFERVTARLWRERVGGGVSAKGTYDASPFEMVNSLRRRADPNTGLAPWPSRRRRVVVNTNGDGYDRKFHRDGTGVDMSAAAAAVAEAVRAANAAEAAVSEADEFRAGVFEDVEETNVGMVRVNTHTNNVSPVPQFNFDDSDASKSSDEVDRLHRLLKDAAHMGGKLDESDVSALDASVSDLFWKVPDFEDRVNASGSFEESEDGDFAPSEWIRKVRENANASANEGKYACEEIKVENVTGVPLSGAVPDATTATADTSQSNTRYTNASPEMPRAVVVFAAAVAFAAVTVLGSQPTVTHEVLTQTTSGVSETGGWVGASSETFLINGVAVEWVTSTWVQFACATTSWFVVLGGVSSVANAVTRGTSRK